MTGLHLLFGLVIVISVSSSVRAVDCSDKEDGGVWEYTCFSYTTCRNGQATEIRCDKFMIFDPQTKTCVDVTSIPWPCDKQMDCSNKADGRYPDIENGQCRTYYTCDHGIFVGHNYCPDGLVFNPELQLCDWEWAVPPPCGTAPITSAASPPPRHQK